MFRRKPTESDPFDSEPRPERPGSKGRPTPSRKESEAAARERAKLGKDPKALSRKQRELRVESSRKVRSAMKTGDERYLPARDQGPVRRFVRDFVDTRLGFTELLAPMLLLIIIMGTGVFGEAIRVFSGTLWIVTLLLVVIDIVWLRFRVRQAVRSRFPDETLKGITWYAISRAVNMRFLRLPKPQRKIGEALPQNYR
ncbi:hypothetical protein BJ980_000996 [Nocardioides daedukensis]|uniref:DUF3043 domain-containing protein n=1 Tax=Nocardioides daedukensis TaxID=634462 RepID=A0A7Y9S0U4_9ACTN|nr:DUF3043 domain-containing protein [Nocardioides daedukensis]NYG58073.1 hypothetical protein [Nocardioides daedukensis]